MKTLVAWRPRRLLPYLFALLGSATLLLSQSPSEAAWDGTQKVELGDTISAKFVGAPLSETHQYAFYAPKDTVVSLQLGVVRGASGLVPELGVFTSNDVPVDLGATKVGNTVKNFKFAASGAYYFRVRATAGTGKYKLVSKVKYPVYAATTTASPYSFDGPAGATITAQVKAAKGSTAKPTITGLTYLGGSVPVTAGAKKIAKSVLPADATYALGFNPGTAGQAVNVKIVLAAAKPANVWSFGIVESTDGIAAQNRSKWLSSAHADHNALPFTDWNDTADRKVPASCAKCHTTTGYRSFLGVDGTPGVVEDAVPVGEVIGCDACHNDQALALTSVTFPSGLSVSGLGKEARCMVCHQGRESTVSVEAKITAAAVPDDDTVSSKISFLNVHYFAAGASLYGREAAGAYEYAEPGTTETDLYLTTLQKRKAYDHKFTHVASKDTCIECHDPHSQQVKVSECATCHVNALGNPVANYADLQEIRMAGTVNDFDGDGDKTEGIAQEIEGLQSVLYAAMQDYATRVAGTSISYDGHTYPYYFVAGTSTKYASWTARLMRAAYNYQYSLKDPGGFAHNGKFIVQFLYDSIEDLNTKLSSLAAPSPVPNFASLHRNDPGHFDSSADAYRHWDEDEAVSASCSRCHSIEGFQFVAEYGIDRTTPAALTSGLSCESCHEVGTSFAPRSFNPNPDKMPARIYVPNVKFPFPTTATSTQISAVTINNGAKGTAAQDDSFICMTCHRARESTLTLDAADVGGLVTNFTLSMKNSHYLPAGAIQYGSKAAVAYQYTGKTYVQRYDHEQNYLQPYPAATDAKARCTFCHMDGGSHSFEPDFAATCAYCHVTSTSIDDLTPAFRAESNYDNNTATKPKAETAVFAARLHLAIQNYLKAAKTAGTSGAEWTVWYGGDNPASTASVGFYKDTSHDGVLQLTELTSSNSSKFDSKAYRAAFNYRLWFNEPGAWAHNPKYTLQFLYDSAENLDPTTVVGLTRP